MTSHLICNLAVYVLTVSLTPKIGNIGNSNNCVTSHWDH